jgi:hypothetical protein
MKKIILYLLAFLIAPLAAISQSVSQSGIDIRYDSDGSGISGPMPPSGANLAGGTHSIGLYPGSPELVGGLYEPHFIVRNTNNVNKQYKIIRKALNVPASWQDQLCWPPTCYTADQDTNISVEVFSTTHTGSSPAPVIKAGTDTTTDNFVAELKPRITPDQGVAGYALYRYYFYDVQVGGYADSVDLSIGFVLGVNQVKPATTFSVGPNPANEFTNVTLGYNDNATAKIVDALGNIVRTETIYNGSKSIDVSDLKNGVYFIMIESPGNKPQNRKLIVRH